MRDERNVPNVGFNPGLDLRRYLARFSQKKIGNVNACELSNFSKIFLKEGI